MKTYVITLSQNFPAKHKKAGTPTWFKEKLQNAIHFERRNRVYVGINPSTKIHTIRANYPLWKKRFEQIERGEACLSVRKWSGKPYCSKQIEIVRLSKEDGIGLQRLDFYRGNFPDSLFYPSIDNKPSDSTELAQNDGLAIYDWFEWFGHYDITKPLAIIHFTKFRY